MIKEENATVSVIVPVYNVEQYLRRCVDTLLVQTYKNIEIILVDDGATDSSGEICDEYAELYKNVHVIHKKNGGLSSARNSGIEVASGNWLAFVDSDDSIEPEFVETLYTLCKKYKTLMSVCKGKKIYEDGSVSIDRTRHVDATNGILVSKYYLLKGYDGFWGTSWNRLCHKDLFRNVRFPEGKIHEDEATTYKLVYQCDQIAVVDKVLYNYYIRSGSITTDIRNKTNLDILDILIEKIDFFSADGDKKMMIAAIVELLFTILEVNQNYRELGIEDFEFKILFKKWYTALSESHAPFIVRYILQFYKIIPSLYKMKGKSIYARIVLPKLYKDCV